MALDLRNLDIETRKYMIQEIEADIASGEVYHSKFLTDQGHKEWDAVLLAAAEKHDSAWLATQFRNERLAVSERTIIDKNGHARKVKLQPESLADSEFNRYYLRGLCLRAIAQGITYVITYRAKLVRNPVSPVGVHISPEALLTDLRNNKGETVHDVPSNPNSGISAMLPLD